MSEAKEFSPEVIVHPVFLTRKEADGINRLLKQLSDFATELSARKLEYIINQSNFRLVILKDPRSDEVIGMASLVINLDLMRTTGFVSSVVVDERYRGKKLGELLVKYLIAMARNKEVVYLSLTSNPKREAANALYIKLGFLLIGQVADSNYYRLYL